MNFIVLNIDFDEFLAKFDEMFHEMFDEMFDEF